MQLRRLIAPSLVLLSLASAGCRETVMLPDAGVDAPASDVGGTDTGRPTDTGPGDTGPDDAGPGDVGPSDSPVLVTLTVALAGDGFGSVSSTPAGIDCGATCELTVPSGTSVTLAVLSGPSSTFQGWSGGCTGSGACALALTADTAVTATFALDHNLGVTLAGSGGGVVSSAPAGIDCGADCIETYPGGTMVTLVATPDATSTFTGWSGDCAGTGSCAVTMDAARNVTANFALRTFDLSVALTGPGMVTSSPTGISCGTTCTAPFVVGSMVTLTAIPNVGARFAGWSGGGCTGTGVCTVTVAAATTVSANFISIYDLTVTRAGTGRGTVTSAPTGINCGADCTEMYDAGTMVTLTAVPDPSSTFTGWSGGGCTGTGTCMVTLAAATTVTGTFTLRTYTLTVARAGAGTGTVTSTPIGINCGADCTEIYTFGTVVTLIAAPAGASTFAGWSGGGCSGTGACVVTLTADTTVTATFATPTYTTTSSWACASGVSCQDVYDITFAAGADVTIAVTGITGASVLRLGAFGPGTALSGANLLTGPSSDRMCRAQNVSDTVTFRALTAGVYRIAVGRDWGSSAGASGNYTLTVTSTSPLTSPSQTVNDAPSMATGTRCGFIYTVSSAWACGAGVSCQDVFDFTTLGSTTVTTAISTVTGASVPRLALFDGAALNTTNRLNGNLADRRCVGQNASDTATSGALPTGLHRAAFGRDWGMSAGASGTYTMTITTPDVPLVIGGQTANDVASSFAATTCP
jgi:hypothetical protein